MSGSDFLGLFDSKPLCRPGSPMAIIATDIYWLWSLGFCKHFPSACFPKSDDVKIAGNISDYWGWRLCFPVVVPSHQSIECRIDSSKLVENMGGCCRLGLVFGSAEAAKQSSVSAQAAAPVKQRHKRTILSKLEAATANANTAETYQGDFLEWRCPNWMVYNGKSY